MQAPDDRWNKLFRKFLLKFFYLGILVSINTVFKFVFR